MTKDDISADALKQHVIINKAQDYLARGRRFADDDVDSLKQKWVAAFCAWVSNLDFDRGRETDDLAAELRLRKLEPPHDSVRDETAILRDKLGRQGSASPEAQRQMEDFVRERNKPPH